MQPSLERGSRILALTLVGAFAVGSAIVASVPTYRESFLAIWRGQPDRAPIWQSNTGYHEDVVLPESDHDEDWDPGS